MAESDLREASPALGRLEVADVTLRFGGVVALRNLSFVCEPGAIHALIGPNGAGKSSLFNCIGGLYRPSAGAIYVDGQNVVGMPPHGIPALGVARTFQHLAMVKNLSVLENVLLGAYLVDRKGLNVLGAALGVGSEARREKRLRHDANRLLDTFGLGAYKNRAVESLPYGHRKRVEIVRASMARPNLMLIDEPAAGLPSAEALEFGHELSRMQKATGCTIVVVEHNMSFVGQIADRCIVLDAGEAIAVGTPEAVIQEPAVIEAYLGANGK